MGNKALIAQHLAKALRLAKTRLLQMLIPHLIPFVFQMLTAIDFDNQFLLKTYKIKDIVHNRKAVICCIPS